MVQNNSVVSKIVLLYDCILPKKRVIRKCYFFGDEVKYLLSKEQYEALLVRLSGRAAVDAYGETEILNIYYDTPDFSLIRKSLEKPIYKEKQQVYRCYAAL